MADAAKPIMTVDLGKYNGSKSFFKIQEIKDLLTNELRSLEWLNKPPATSVGGLWHYVSSNITNIFDLLNMMSDDDLNRIQDLKSLMRQAFVNAGIPLSSSPVRKFIDTLREESPETAAAAFAAWASQPSLNLHVFSHLKGAMLMAAFDAQLAPETSSAVGRSLEELAQAFEQSRSQTEARALEQRQEFQLSRARERRAVARSIVQARRRDALLRTNSTDSMKEVTSRIQQTEALYREQMRIKAPVEYWSQKAKGHRQKTAAYRLTLIIYALAALFVLPVFLYFLGDHIVSTATADKPPAIYFVNVTIGVVIVTIAFWAARILTRLYLSEMHLAIDAEERAVMAQTYLALTAEGQATEEDRAIVLASLFRPTADGIVKDDGAPDLSPASLISRLGAK